MRLRGIFNLFLATALTILAGCGGGGSSTGGGGGSVPASVALTASQPTSVINIPITITATVKQANGTAVSDGTNVTFSATGGTGATFTPATATTTSGIATATFTTTNAGTFAITATAGSVTSSPFSMLVAAQATKAIVKLKTSGSLPPGTLIGGITATLNYPTTKGLSVTESDVVLSGGVTGVFVPNVNIPGQVTFGNLNISPGIAIGEFLTATFTIAAGSPQVAAGDFAIATGASVIDINGATLSGIPVEIQSVTFQ